MVDLGEIKKIDRTLFKSKLYDYTYTDKPFWGQSVRYTLKDGDSRKVGWGVVKRFEKAKDGKTNVVLCNLINTKCWRVKMTPDTLFYRRVYF